MRKALRLGVMATLIASGAAAASASLGPTPREVYRVWLNGRLADLTRSAADDYAPVISPDGRQVAIVSDLGIKGHRVRVFVVGSNGRRRRPVSPPLSKEQDFSYALAWSPGSKRLAFADDEQIDAYHEVFSLYLFTPGAGTRIIARAPVVFAPAWSPDGRVIAFQGVRKVWGVTPAGKVLWRLRGEAFMPDGDAGRRTACWQFCGTGGSRCTTSEDGRGPGSQAARSPGSPAGRGSRPWPATGWRCVRAPAVSSSRRQCRVSTVASGSCGPTGGMSWWAEPGS